MSTRTDTLKVRYEVENEGKVTGSFSKVATSGAQLQQQVNKTGQSLEYGAKSAREIQFALRGLPAQVTDIFTALQSGQRPLQVLLQQGGQLKDMFGGIGPAARALGGYLASLANIYTVSAAGVGLLGLAWNEAEKRQASFERTTIITGNRLEMTADQLEAFKDRLTALAGVSDGEAADAINKIALVGGLSREQFELATTASLQWKDATGTAIEDTVRQFRALQKDPVDALAELRDQYGGVTEAQIDHIRKLIDEGDQQAAVTEAFQVWAGIIGERSPQIVAHLDPIDRMLRSISDIAHSAFDAIGNGIHDTAREAENGFASLGRFLGALSLLRAGPGGMFGFGAAMQAPNVAPQAPKPDRVAQDQSDWDALQSVYSQAHVDAANREAEAWVRAGEEAARALKKHQQEAESAVREMEALNRQDERYYDRSVAQEDAISDLLRLSVELRSAQAGRNTENSFDLEALQHGREYLDMLRRRIELEQDYQRQVAELNRRAASDRTVNYDAELAKIEEFHGKALDAEAAYQQARKALQSDWRVGARAAMEDFVSDTEDAAGQSYNVLSRVFDDALDAAERFGRGGSASVKDFVENAIADFTRLELRIGLSKILQMILGMVGGGTPSAAWASGFGNNTGWLTDGSYGGNGGAGFSLTAHANGGVFGPNGPIPLRTYSMGGIATSPQLALYGEGRQAEAYVPLPDGRSIPVTMQGGGNVNVNVYGAPSQPQVDVRRGANGLEIDLLFAGMEKRLAGRVMAGQGDLYRAQKQRFNLKEPV